MAEPYFDTCVTARHAHAFAGSSTLVVAAVFSALATSPAAAQDACAFFSGKTVELVIPFSAGGGYDIYGRMVAKYMGPELGAANMIVVNQPGAGGLLATNQTFVAEPDGLTIQLVSVIGTVSAELGEADGVQYESNEFSWIGRISSEPDVVVVAPGSEIESLEDIQAIGAERPVRIGSTGLGSPQYISIKLLADFVGTESSIITGFAGAPEVFSSLARGEVDLFVASLSAGISAEGAETARILWAFGTEGVADRTDVSPLSEVVDEAFQPLNVVHGDAITAGRALAAPPGVAEDRLGCLRDAFDRAIASDALLAEAAELDRPVEPMTGTDLAALVQNATEGAPGEYLELVREAFAQ